MTTSSQRTSDYKPRLFGRLVLTSMATMLALAMICGDTQADEKKGRSDSKRSSSQSIRKFSNQNAPKFNSKQSNSNNFKPRSNSQPSLKSFQNNNSRNFNRGESSRNSFKPPQTPNIKSNTQPNFNRGNSNITQNGNNNSFRERFQNRGNSFPNGNKKLDSGKPLTNTPLNRGNIGENKLPNFNRKDSNVQNNLPKFDRKDQNVQNRLPKFDRKDQNGKNGLQNPLNNLPNNRKDKENVVGKTRERFNNNNNGKFNNRVFKTDPKMEKLPTLDKDRLLTKDMKIDRNTIKGKRLPKFEIDRKGNQDLVKNLNNNMFKGDKLIARTKGNLNDKDVRFNGIDRVIRPEKLDRLANIDVGKKVNLGKQFDLQRQGDLNRRLDLGANIHKRGGWRNRNFIGGVNASFTRTHFSSWYVGPGFYPRYCWTPRWSSWVSWCWWDHCYPICDPRPIIVRPIVCQPAPTWVYYETPVWQPLPVATCGTWVDVPPAEIAQPDQIDVQLLAVRFVDPGHVEQELGPRYRVWIRNNSSAPITQPFSITLLGGNDDRPLDGLPQTGVVVESLEADQVTSVDVRLPHEVNSMGVDEQGRKVPFSFLHVIVDSGRELNDAFRENNGIGIKTAEVLPIDPWAFAPESDTVPMGSIINVAGEGFGPEPGEIFVVYDGQQYPAEIYGWYDLGVRFQVPSINMGGEDKTAEILVIRGDGAAANPIEVDLATEATVLAPPTPEAQ
ncbi:MAG: hypothetical protein KDA65_05935 [Planctomycetaceae bacterium]|nr:hypothetical protein [Planctomycetaceae bacterium]